MISVFGATGFIGNRFCSLYADDVIPIPRDSKSPQTEDVLYFISTIHNYNIFTDPHLDIDTNLTLLVEVLENCRKNNPEGTVFNFISSWFVYGKTPHLPVSERDACNPKGFYSITKRAAEQLLISYCETYNMKYRILRLANVYGTGDNKVSKKKNALQYMIDEVANNRDINLYDGGVHVRDFIYVDDVCSALKLCVEKAPINQIINIGTGVPTSIGEAMGYVREELGSTAKFNHVEPPHFHNVVQVKNMYLDVTKLKDLNFVPQYDIKRGLDKLLENYRK
jgi:nucleoside-diphosphate-sugar epimerase